VRLERQADIRQFSEARKLFSSQSPPSISEDAGIIAIQMKNGLPDHLPRLQPKLGQRPSLRKSEGALSINCKKDDWRFSDDPAQVLFGVA
jgi:hypothetical protein